MEITIAHYRNIEKLGITIADGKVNYLFGICGSGKSSVLDAISKPVEPGDATIGAEELEPSIKVDGELPNYDEVSTYSISRQTALFEKKASEEIYHVFVGDESVLRSLEAEFEESIEKLRSILDRLYGLRGRVENLGKQFSRPGVRGYGRASKLRKAQDAIKNASESLRTSMSGKSMAHLDWKTKGFSVTDEFEKGICPFCETKLAEETKAVLTELKEAALKEMKPAIDASPLLEALNVHIPDFTDDDQVKELEQTLIELFKVQQEVDKVIAFCNVAKGSDLLHGIPRDIEVDDAVYKLVPELRPLIEDVKSRKKALSEQLGKMSAAFKRIVKSNSLELNKQLRSVGVPYEFAIDNDKMNRDDHQASYVLKHVESSSEVDMRDRLSYGERNLVALLLFLHNNESGVVLIDDPASSYDDFRRSQIYSCIMEQRDRTVLVVSHDQAFVRRAVNDSSNPKLGEVLYLDNKVSICETRPITRRSFVFLDSEIKNRIEQSESYYQKILNARLYCELHKDEMDDVVWGYTSAILHGTEKQKVSSLLGSRGVSESEVLDTLNEAGICLKPMPEKIEMVLDENATTFEILVLLREILRSRKATLTEEERLDLEMLNDLVHMNDNAWYCLNPYEYDIWPARLGQLAEKYREDSLTLVKAE